MYGDDEIMRYIARPMSRRQALLSFRATLQAMREPDGLKFFVIERTTDAEPLGICSIQPHDRRNRRVEIGIMLTREARRQSVGRQTIGALLTRAFKALPIDSVWVQYQPANVAADQLFAGLGFSRKSRIRPKGARRGQTIRVMPRSSWNATTTTTRGNHNVEHRQFS